jgi:hypothetical protein
MIRSVARVTVSRGQGHGTAIALIRIRPGANAENLRAKLRETLDPAALDGIISMHLIEGDPVLSKPLTDNPDTIGAGDWFAVVEGTHVDAVSAAVAGRFDRAISSTSSNLISIGTYLAMWGLQKADL